MSLDEKIIPALPGARCACGKCDLTNIRTHDVRGAVKMFLKRENSLGSLGISKEKEDEIYKRIKNKADRIFGEGLT